MRDAQEKISARMLALLGLTFKTLRAEIAAGLVQSLQEGEGGRWRACGYWRGRNARRPGRGAASPLGRILSRGGPT
jgi:hypothetical protein